MGSLGFGFAVDGASGQVVFNVYAADDTLLATTTVVAGGSPPSSFPENGVNLPFAGVAAYATFDFQGPHPRYIIDNLAGTYGSTERVAVIDIKPGSCPNPFNGKSQGSVPVAIVGHAGFDVSLVDLDSLLLAGVPIVPENVLIADVTQPGDYDPADCYDCFNEDDYLTLDTDGDGVPDTYEGDGYLDLVVKFDTQALAAAIGPAAREECIELELVGLTLGGLDISASDSMVIKTKIK